MKVQIAGGCLVCVGILMGTVPFSMATEAVPDSGQAPALVVMIQGELTLDGKLDEADWMRAPVHALSLLDSSDKLPDLTRNKILADPYEGGSVRFLLGEKFLYLGIAFDDHDIVVQGEADQTALFGSGDVAEVFIKADNSPGYFELYASPLGNKTSYFFPSSSYMGLPECFSCPLIENFEVKANVQGTVNNFKDVDKGWTAEMAIPLAGLKEKLGVDFAPGQPWRILVSRYNYGYTMRAKQFSSHPKLPQINYHLIEYYSPVVFPHETEGK